MRLKGLLVLVRRLCMCGYECRLCQAAVNTRQRAIFFLPQVETTHIPSRRTYKVTHRRTRAGGRIERSWTLTTGRKRFGCLVSSKLLEWLC